MIGRESSSMATIQRPAVLAREILLLKNKRNGNNFPLFLVALFFTHLQQKKETTKFLYQKMSYNCEI